MREFCEAKFPFGGRNASYAAPKKPGTQNETKRDFVSVKVDREFSQQKNLKGQGNEAQKKWRKKIFQLQIPGMRLLQNLHLPCLSSIFPI